MGGSGQFLFRISVLKGPICFLSAHVLFQHQKIRYIFLTSVKSLSLSAVYSYDFKCTKYIFAFIVARAYI